MARTTTRKRPTAKSVGTRSAGSDAFKLREPKEAAHEVEPLVHIIRKGVRCDTEKRGYATPKGRSPLEIVVDASEGFIPLWAKDTTLRWRFRESSLQSFEDPHAAKAAIEQLLGEAILAWEDAVPESSSLAEAMRGTSRS